MSMCASAPLGAGGVGSIPSNSDAQNVPSFRRWRFEMKLSPLRARPCGAMSASRGQRLPLQRLRHFVDPKLHVVPCVLDGVEPTRGHQLELRHEEAHQGVREAGPLLMPRPLLSIAGVPFQRSVARLTREKRAPVFMILGLRHVRIRLLHGRRGVQLV
jgi:hypothetical protein